MGWTAWKPNVWRSETGATYVLDSSAGLAGAERLIRSRLACMVWQRASASHLGRGLEHGPPALDHMRRHLDQVRAASPAFATALFRVACAGWWCEARRHEAGYLDEDTCWDCGRPGGTVAHHVWHCPATLASQHPDIVASSHLVHRGQHEDAAATPAYWTRGLCVAHRLPALDPAPDWVVRFGASTPENLLHGALATDGAGGIDREPALARCGWGWALVSPDLRVVAGACGSVPPPSTVPRAETQAIIDAVQTHRAARQDMSQDPFVFTDHLNLVKFCAESGMYLARSRQSVNFDLHHELADLLREAPFHVQKIKAHFERVLEGKTSAELFDATPDAAVVANVAADALAEWAASELQLPEQQRTDYRAALDESLLVWRRVAAVYQRWCTDHSERLAERTARQPARPARVSRFAAALRASEHRVQSCSMRLLCTLCHSLSNRGQASKLEWMRTPCGPAGSRFSVASSHRMVYQMARSRYFCARCYRHAGNPRGLRAPCPGGRPPPEGWDEQAPGTGGDLELVEADEHLGPPGPPFGDARAEGAGREGGADEEHSGRAAPSTPGPPAEGAGPRDRGGAPRGSGLDDSEAEAWEPELSE